MSQTSNETGSPVTPDPASDQTSDPIIAAPDAPTGDQPPAVPDQTFTGDQTPSPEDAPPADSTDVSGQPSGGYDPADDQTTVLTDQGGAPGADPGDATVVIPVTEGADGDADQRVTRDELYARQDRQGERERLAAVRAEHEAALGNEQPSPVTAPAPAPAAKPLTRKERRQLIPVTDRFFGSLGLFVLRWSLAVAFGAHGVQKLLSMDQTSQFFATLTVFGTPLPFPSVLAIATGVAEVMIAVSLIFGFLTRFAGVGMILIGVGALLTVQWTALPNPLAPGASGVQGELELILAGAGVLFLCTGAGGWSLDRLFRRDRSSGLEAEEA